MKTGEDWTHNTQRLLLKKICSRERKRESGKISDIKKINIRQKRKVVNKTKY